MTTIDAAGAVPEPEALAQEAKRSRLLFWWQSAAVERRRVAMVIGMTLLLLIISGPREWYARVPLTLMAVAGLLVPRVTQTAGFWLFCASVMCASNLVNWHSADNHKHLLGYWCLALWLSVGAANPSEVIRQSARWLIGLVFLFAVTWKIRSPDFLSGAFFEHTLLFDPRFSGVAKTLGEMLPRELDSNARLISAMAHESGSEVVVLASSPRIVFMAKVMAIWTVVIEGALGLSFLLSNVARLSPLRDLLLLVFVVTTYVIAPVLGFGYLLLILGFAQTRPKQLTLRVGYLVMFAGLYVVNVPWYRLLVLGASLGGDAN